MGYCCVPGCGESGGNGVSLHEIPADFEVRMKWLKAISRDNWIPSSNSNYSRVCSRHFTQDDFKQGLKKMLLFKSAVPSIFPSRPKYMQSAGKKTSTSSIRKKENLSISSRTYQEINDTIEEVIKSSMINEETDDQAEAFIAKK